MASKFGDLVLCPLLVPARPLSASLRQAECSAQGDKFRDRHDGFSRSFLRVRPNERRAYPACVEPRPARPERLPDARHLSHWLDLPVPRVSLALTVRLLQLAAQWWSILVPPGRRVSF